MRPNPFSLGRTRQNDRMEEISKSPMEQKSFLPPQTLGNTLMALGGGKAPVAFEARGQTYDEIDLQSTNMKQEKYYINIQSVVNPNNTKVACTIMLPILPGQKKKFIQIESISSFILQYPGSDFPAILGLGCQTLDGYLLSNGVPSHLLSLATGKISSTIPKATMSLSNIFYKSEGSVLWDVTGLTQINFNVYAQNQIIDMPLQNPITLMLKVIRVII